MNLAILNSVIVICCCSKISVISIDNAVVVKINIQLELYRAVIAGKNGACGLINLPCFDLETILSVSDLYLQRGCVISRSNRYESIEILRFSRISYMPLSVVIRIPS